MSNANAFQQPMFAPVSQGANAQQNDDIDFNEIFADYFASEFEDPLNAYTSSMANYSGAAAAVALSQKQQQQQPQATALVPQSKPSQSTLPTGGIKTAWHSGALPNLGNGVQPQQQQQQQQQTQPVQPIQQVAVQPQPTQKKLKVETPPAVAPTQGSVLSGRLGFSMVGSQVAQQQAVAPGPAVPAPAVKSVGNVALPVGVGIRLGGAGGVAPQTAQHVMQRPGGQGQYMMWGGMQGGMNQGSDQAVAERRQRNREHAKRSRVRKKFMLESLQEQVRQLQKENVELRMIVQEKIPAHAQQIISECCSKNPLFADVDQDAIKNGTKDNKKETELVQTDFSLISSLTSGQQNFVLSDPRLPDNPIVYASEGFYALTGYGREEVLGRNCRFLQGPGTDPRAVEIIRSAIANGSDATTCILNYKADGTPFWNQFFVAALRDADNCIVNFVGVQCEVESEAGASALEEKVNAVLPLQDKSAD